MPTVSCRLPSLLAKIVGDRHVALEAKTLEGALSELVRQHPALSVHLFDETGALRQHVLCFHNETNTRWLEDMGVPVEEGDVLTIMQAVSGG